MTDNVTSPIPSTTKFKSKDTGTNGHLMGHTLYDEAEAEVLGKVTASPTANTVLGRLKDLLTGIVLAAGSNVIGAVTQSGTWTVQPGNTANTTAWKVDGSAVTQPVSVASIPSHAVTNAGTFAVQATQETSSISNAGTGLTPKFQKITASSSGATTIVAAVTSKKIRVLAWDTVVNAAVNFKWQSRVTPTDLTGLYYMAGQGGGVARAFNPVGYFETVAGEALDINLSSAVAVGGVLTYVEV